MRGIWIATTDLEPGAASEASDYVVEWQIHPDPTPGPASGAAGVRAAVTLDALRRRVPRQPHPSMYARAEN